MALRRLYKFFLKNELYMKELLQKITELEKQLYTLKDSELNQKDTSEPIQHPIVIEIM